MTRRHRTPLFLGTLAAVVGGLAVNAALAQNERQDRHRVPAEYMSFRAAQWLERDERIVEERPEDVLDAMTLEPGDVVADVGCGSGYYARRIARRIQPGGTVYCEDIQPEMLEVMEQLAETEGVVGIEPVLGTFTDPKLPEGEIDWIIIADVYHEMSDPEPMLAGIRKALSPDGRVALLEYRVEDGSGDHVKADHTMSVRQVLLEWKAAGFELVGLYDFLPGQHLFFFRSASGDADGEALRDIDLFDAIDSGVADVQASGAGEDAVTIRIRRIGDSRIVVTSPVGVHFTSEAGRGDMIARRDGWIVLSDDEWHEWTIRAIRRGNEAPGAADRLTLHRPDTNPGLAALMYEIQTGTYAVADSPTLYPPRTHQVEQAALWISEADRSYDELLPHLDDPRVPPQYAVAFALVFVDRAGTDVTGRKVWNDRERVFGGLRDRGLNAWYQIKTTGQFTR